jgi:amidase
MAIRILRNQIFYAFSSSLSSVARVRQGEEFILETNDCFEGQIKKVTDLANKLDWDHINPATGPIYIEGVKPGDILKIDILEIKVAEQSVVTATPSQGVIGDLVKEAETLLLPLTRDYLTFNGHLKIPIRPMIGVIGVAPASGNIPNGVPDRHGGNMDLHAVMGDGEIISTGAETDGEVKMRAQVIDLDGLPTPFLETSDSVSAISSAKSVDDAASQATHAMADFIVKLVGLPINEAGMLMSLVGQLKICQVVDPQRTVRFEFPKWVLTEYGYSLP